ncbi:MAG: cation-translocating P-type ATPase [Bacilli bacterium]
MEYYELNKEEVIHKLNSSLMGLSNEEVIRRQKLYGKNELKVINKNSKLIKFFKQFQDLMIGILLVAAVISFLVSILNKTSFVDSIIILAIIFVNAVLGFIQEMKADKAIDSLKKMQESNVKVKRDGKLCVIDSKDVVIGDVLVLEAGDTVCADARIIWEVQLEVNESSLTGESIEVKKDILPLEKGTILAKRKNMIYSGTAIIYGKCHAIVTDTGMNTEIGLIAKSLDINIKEFTPLEKKIDDISKALSIIIGIIIVIMMIVGITKKMEISSVIMLSISLAVAAIPEGLPAVITIVLSLGVSSMAKKNAIVRQMSSVETLGSTEIICSDKTGTITQNKMCVKRIFFNNKFIDDLKTSNILIDIMILNNDVEKSESEYIGEATEIALYSYADAYENIDKVRSSHERLDELPFDSSRKMMSTINKYGNKNKLLTKGSFDSIIKRCSRILIDDKEVKLDDEIRDKLNLVETSESNKAYRVIAYAYKDIEDDYVLSNNLESDMVFVGLSSMIDPPRENVKESIAICKKANIRPILITGDSLSTATAIARETGILVNDDEAITGEELDKFTFEELVNEVNKYNVYARVSPTNKLAIVDAWQENNKIVAMTGDGVNDAPALKTADIGIGMGITGTEVSKGVSDIILADDSFSTIVIAVEEGRRIFDNIRNVLVYLLTGNIAEVLVVFIGMMFGLEIFLPIQLLYINLITDSIPATALAFEKAGDNIMNRKVRKKNSSFFTNFLVAKMVTSGILKTISILCIYFINIKIFNLEVGATMAFLTLVLQEMIFAYSCRNLKCNVINKNIFSNTNLNKCLLLLSVFQILIFVTPLRSVFHLCTLSFIQVFYCFLSVFLMFIMDEGSKKFISKRFKD